MPEEVRNLCRLADISSKSLLLQVVRQDTPEKMTALIEKIASQGGATRQQLREAAAKPKAGPAEALRLRVPAADQGVQPEAQFQQEPRVARRDHRRARSHHQGPPQGEVALGAPAASVVAARRGSRHACLRAAGSRHREPRSRSSSGVGQRQRPVADRVRRERSRRRECGRSTAARRLSASAGSGGVLRVEESRDPKRDPDDESSEPLEAVS